jgi:hypothetical protein
VTFAGCFPPPQEKCLSGSWLTLPAGVGLPPYVPHNVLHVSTHLTGPRFSLSSPPHRCICMLVRGTMRARCCFMVEEMIDLRAECCMELPVMSSFAVVQFFFLFSLSFSPVFPPICTPSLGWTAEPLGTSSALAFRSPRDLGTPSCGCKASS